MSKKVIYVYEVKAGVYNVYTKKETLGTSTILTHLYTMSRNSIKHIPLTGNNIIIESAMITGKNVMYIDTNKAGNIPLYEYIQRIVFP